MPTTKLVLDAEGKRLWAAFEKTHRLQDKTVKKSGDVARASKEGQREQEGSAQSLTTSLGQQLAKLVSIGTATAAATGAIRLMYASWRAEIESTAALSKEMHSQMLDAMFLGDNVGDPKFRERMHGMASQYGVVGGAAEVAKGQYMLQSATGGQSPEMQKALFDEMLQFRQITSLPLDQMAPLFADPANMFASEFEGMAPGQAANTIQNVTKRTIDLAKTTPEMLRQNFPRVLGAGKLGGLEYRETAAMFARATALTGTTQQAATAMENLINNTMFPTLNEDERSSALSRLSPDRRAAVEAQLAQHVPEDITALYKAAGINKEDDHLTRMRKLAEAEKAGHFPKELQVQLWGRRGIRIGAPMMDAGLSGVEAYIEDFNRTTGPNVDIVGSALEQRASDDPRFALQLRNQQLKAKQQEEKLRSEEIAMADENAELQMEVNIRNAAGGELKPQDHLLMWYYRRAYRQQRFVYDLTGGEYGTSPGAQNKMQQARDAKRREADEQRMNRGHGGGASWGPPAPDPVIDSAFIAPPTEEAARMLDRQKAGATVAVREVAREFVTAIREEVASGIMGPPAPTDEVNLINIGVGARLYRTEVNLSE